MDTLLLLSPWQWLAVLFAAAVYAAFIWALLVTYDVTDGDYE